MFLKIPVEPIWHILKGIFILKGTFYYFNPLEVQCGNQKVRIIAGQCKIARNTHTDKNKRDTLTIINDREYICGGLLKHPQAINIIADRMEFNLKSTSVSNTKRIFMDRLQEVYGELEECLWINECKRHNTSIWRLDNWGKNNFRTT